MAKVGKWSTNAGSNNTTPPDGWPEGQAPSTINDCAREMMAAIRTYLNTAQWFDMDNTPSFLTASTFSLGAADVTNFHVGRRVKFFDSSVMYGTIESVSGTTVTMRMDNNAALTNSLSSCALSILTETNSALPEAAQAPRKNYIINGNLNIWQRTGTIAAITTAGFNNYAADRLAVNSVSTATLKIERMERSQTTTNVPTIQQAGVLLNNAMRVSVGAADAALSAGDYLILRYIMEGYDWANLAHRPFVHSFWAKTNRTGVYACAYQNYPRSVSYVQNFTITAADAWTRVCITVPEAPNTGYTWNYSQSAGLDVSICLAGGSNWVVGATGNWTAGNVMATSGMTNFMLSAGNSFSITGMRLEAGTQAGPLQNPLMAEEMALCQRYCWKGLPGSALNFPGYVDGAVMGWPVMLPVTMRSTPAVSADFSGITLSAIKGNPSVAQPTPNGFRLIASGSGVNANCAFTFGANDYILADADFT